MQHAIPEGDAPPELQVACAACPLRTRPMFYPPGPGDLDLIESMRGPQKFRHAGQVLIREGEENAPLFTLFAGWAFRFKTLSDGRRQILNFLLPGDFVGLQQRVTAAAAHGVEALTDVWMCSFRRDSVWLVHRAAPELGYGLTWLAAQEETLVDDHLLSVGRRNASERVAALLLTLFKRVMAVLPGGSATKVPFPLTQQHIADALGLSLAHTHRTLRSLEKAKLYRLKDGELEILDQALMASMAELWRDGRPPVRPLM